MAKKNCVVNKKYNHMYYSNFNILVSFPLRMSAGGRQLNGTKNSGKKWEIKMGKMGKKWEKWAKNGKNGQNGQKNEQSGKKWEMIYLFFY